MENQRASISIVESNQEAAPKAPELTAAALHVWEVPLIVPEASFLDCKNLLSKDEAERASRFHFERDARKFTVARGSMRSILSRYSGLPAKETRFLYSKHGKPSLAGGGRDIRFSISHSGDYALVAVALGREIGVDIEKIREDIETDKLAERFFSESERGAIRALRAEHRVLAFFRCWTCKEAFLKAQGVGLSRPLGSFDVEVNPLREAQLLATRPDHNESHLWVLCDIAPAAGYAAAIAAEGVLQEVTVLRHGRS